MKQAPAGFESHRTILRRKRFGSVQPSAQPSATPLEIHELPSPTSHSPSQIWQDVIQVDDDHSAQDDHQASLRSQLSDSSSSIDEPLQASQAPFFRRSISVPFLSPRPSTSETRSNRLSSITESNNVPPPSPSKSSNPSASPVRSQAPVDDSYSRKWTGTFYIWIYEQAHPSQSNSTLSKHFFNNASLSSSSSIIPSTVALPASAIGKVVLNQKKKKHLIGLAKRDSTTQLLSPLELNMADSKLGDLSPLSSPTEPLDSLTDRSAIDPAEISPAGLPRYKTSSKDSKRSSKSDSISSKKKLPSLVTGPTSRSSHVLSSLRLGPGPAMNQEGSGAGQWRLVQGVITEDGYFTLYTNENVMIQRIYLPSYRRTDIRLVHHSIFGRVHCGVISRRSPASHPVPSNPSRLSPPSARSPVLKSFSLSSRRQSPSPSSIVTTTTTTTTTSKTTTTTMTTTANVAMPTPGAANIEQQRGLVIGSGTTGNEVSLYVCMPNSVLLESWLVICKCFSRPDDFRHLYPRIPNAPPTPSPYSKPDPNNPPPTPAASIKPERVRIWRGLEIVLIEGKKLGELRHHRIHSLGALASNNGAGPLTPGSSRSIVRSLMEQSNNSEPLPTNLEAFSLGITPSIDSSNVSVHDQKPSSLSVTANPTTSNNSLSHVGGGNNKDNDGREYFYFVELVWEKEVVGRSTIKRNSSPYWREDYKISDLGSFKHPLRLDVYQIRKQLKSPVQLIGSGSIELKSLIKDRANEIWVPIIPVEGSSSSTAGMKPKTPITTANTTLISAECVGELNLSVVVFEQIVLGEHEYRKMVEMLNDDDDIDLPYSLSHLALSELDRLSELLMRIYEASGKLILRLSQMTSIEVDGDISTASILFRGNSLLTKMVEGYMRLVGFGFLESSIGPIIRRVCGSKLEFEIDPSKLPGNHKSNLKTVEENTRGLEALAREIWQSIYLNRSKCPTRLRAMFSRIQSLVTISYADQDMRLTSVSAFIFLRFFVPSILNPRLFGLVQFQPDAKSQRTLTLLAKTLQGLGNLTLFGVKEAFMSSMNNFIRDHLDAFRDYISFIAADPGPLSTIEWTSPEFDGYGLPIALRSSLPPQCKDGVPTLPHLLDPIKDCAVLATLVSRFSKASSSTTMSSVQRKGSCCSSSQQPQPHLNHDNNPQNHHMPSGFEAFCKICENLDDKASRRYWKIVGASGSGINSVDGGSFNNHSSTSISAINGNASIVRRRAGTVAAIVSNKIDNS